MNENDINSAVSSWSNAFVAPYSRHDVETVGAPIATDRFHFLRLTFRRFIRALHVNAAAVTAAIANKSNSSSSLYGR